MQADSPLIKKAASVEVLSSPLIPSIVAYGRAIETNGRSITLAYGGSTMNITVKDGAEISSFKVSDDSLTMATTQKAVDFSEIKPGDTLNIIIKVLPDGQLQGESVIIFPPFIK
jgi:hypothetical protein